jgi:hypothetical protein
MYNIKKILFNQNKEKISEKKLDSKNNSSYQRLGVNSKTDKDVIKILKGQIKDLENLIKLKDDEIKMYNKNRNNVIKINNCSNVKNYNNNISKKNLYSDKQDLDQVYSEKNLKNFNIINTISKNKSNKKNINCIINNSNKNNNNKSNYTINASSSKNYFENISKKLSTIQVDKFMDISYSHHRKIPKRFQKKDNNNNNDIKNKSKKIDISFQYNKSSSINSKRNLLSNDYKDLNKKSFLQKEKRTEKKEIPKLKLKFQSNSKEVSEIADNFGECKTKNYNEEYDSNYHSAISNKNNENISKEKVRPIKILKNNFYLNILDPKNNYNSKASQNKINLIKDIKNNLNHLNKEINSNNNSNATSAKKKNKIKIINNKSNSVAKSIKRIIKKDNNKNIKERNNKNDNIFIDTININMNCNNNNNEKKSNSHSNKGKIYRNEKYNDYEFIVPDKYKNNNNYKLIKKIESEGKTIYIYKNKKEILFKSGVRKQIFNDGYQLVYFPNGDKKQILIEGTSIYYFNESKTVQTSYKDGLNVFKFNNNQIEKHYPDGSKFIIFPNGMKRRISKNGNEETIFPDGKIQKYSRYEKKYSNDEDIWDSVDESNNENKNVFMSYLDIEDNDIND